MPKIDRPSKLGPKSIFWITPGPAKPEIGPNNENISTWKNGLKIDVFNHRGPANDEIFWKCPKSIGLQNWAPNRYSGSPPVLRNLKSGQIMKTFQPEKMGSKLIFLTTAVLRTMKFFENAQNRLAFKTGPQIDILDHPRSCETWNWAK